MIHLTIALPDAVAQQYYSAAEQIGADLQVENAPTAPGLMRFMLAAFTADDIAAHFDRAVRNLTNAPMPDESDLWIEPKA